VKEGFLTGLEIQSELKQIIIDAMLSNTDVRIESTENIEVPGERAPGILSLFTGAKTEGEMEYIYEPKG